jgi:hypothetical protein
MSRYNHAYTVAFSIDSDNEAENVTEEELLEGMYARFRDLSRCPGEVLEAVGIPWDTYVYPEEEEPQPVKIDTIYFPGISDPRYELDLKREVSIYRNLNSGCWSVKQDGLVKGHIQYSSPFALTDVQFKVSEPGRLRVIRERRKNVHAVARGILSEHAPPPIPDPDKAQKITYDPYKYESFVIKATEEPIHLCDKVVVQNGSILIAS